MLKVRARARPRDGANCPQAVAGREFSAPADFEVEGGNFFHMASSRFHGEFRKGVDRFEGRPYKPLINDALAPPTTGG